VRIPSVQNIDKYIFLTGGPNEGDKTEIKHGFTPSASTETCQRILNDFFMSPGSSHANLLKLLEEVRRGWDQNGSGSFEEAVLSSLPMESIVQYINTSVPR
jgi:hypothetical protein